MFFQHLIPLKPRLLLEDASYAMEQVSSIVKKENIGDCDEFAPTSIEEAVFHDLAKVLLPITLSYFVTFLYIVD